MRRLFVLLATALVLTALGGGFGVLAGVSSFPIVPGIMLVAYAAIVHPPVEAAIAAALVGLAMDALGGTPLGLNILSCVAVLVGSRPFVGWVPSPRGIPSALFVGSTSAAYAFVSLLLLFLFQRRESFGLVGVFSTGLTNGLASVAIFPVLRWAFVALGVEDRGESLQERLASKS